MGNCLVTKLKGAVDNDNLPIMGVIKLVAKTAITTPATFSFNKAWIKEYSGVTFYLNGTEVSFESIGTEYQNFITITATEGAYILLDKYATFTINGDLATPLAIEYGLDKYSFVQGLGLIRPQAMALDGILDESLKSFFVYGGMQEGGLSYNKIKEMFPNLEAINIGSSSVAAVSGTIVDIATMPALFQVHDYGNTRYVGSWNSPTLRPSSAPIIAINYGNSEPQLWFSTSSAKNFLINMASCQVPEGVSFTKKIHIAGYDSSDPEVAAAIATLAEKGYTVG